MEPFKVDTKNLPILRVITHSSYVKWRALALDTIQLYGANVIHPVRLISKEMTDALSLTWETDCRPCVYSKNMDW